MSDILARMGFIVTGMVVIDDIAQAVNTGSALTLDKEKAEFLGDMLKDFANGHLEDEAKIEQLGWVIDLQKNTVMDLLGIIAGDRKLRKQADAVLDKYNKLLAIKIKELEKELEDDTD